MEKQQNLCNPQDFFILGHSWAKQYFWASTDLSLIPDKYYRNGMKGFSGKIQVKILKGGKAPDVLGCGALMFIVSEKVIEIFQKYSLQKYGAYDIDMVDGRKGKKRSVEPIPKYTGIYFLGKGGAIDDKASQTKYSVFEDGTKALDKINGIYFDLNNWDGSDLFYIEPLTSLPIITRRVKEILEKEGIMGYKLRCLDEFVA